MTKRNLKDSCRNIKADKVMITLTRKNYENNIRIHWTEPKVINISKTQKEGNKRNNKTHKKETYRNLIILPNLSLSLMEILII